ncbi:squalene synthetase-like protein [Exophiala oligosperma]
MGARQRAQARINKGSSARSSKRSQTQPNSFLHFTESNPHNRHQALLGGWQDFSESSSPHPRNGHFSMSEEARNTERHTATWGPSRLRDRAVAFVSAGTLVREEPPVNAKEITSEELEQSAGDDGNTLSDAKDKAVEQDQITIATIQQPVEKAAPVTTAEPSIINKTEPRRCSVSSVSSDEIIFTGRQNNSRPRPAKVDNSSSPQIPSPPTTSTIPDPHHPTADFSNGDRPQKDPTPLPHTVRSIPLRKRNVDRRGRPLIFSSRREEEEAIMNDYIANLAFDDDSDEEEDTEQTTAKPSRRNEHFRFHDNAAESHVKVQTKSATRRERPKSAPAQAIDWDSADLEDFDDLSTTDEEVVEVTQVLRHRERPSGPQYLVTLPGRGASEARWILDSKLTSRSARDEISIFTDIQAIQFENTSDDLEHDDSDSDDDDDDFRGDVDDDHESEVEENERTMERVARMTDEQIARAFAKQAEVGIGGDELLLFDGQVDDEEDDRDIDEFVANNDFINFSSKKHLSSRGKSKRNRRQRDTFPPAEAFADALEQDPYGAFDIMDFDRPSLRPKNKGRKSGPFEWGLEDEELAQHLHNTWSKDREKKAARKRERREAQEDALLEAAERNSPAMIKAEIRRFLVQEIDVLELAPMDSSLRSGIHRLAKALKLKSHSEGKEGCGRGRYPVLTKGPHTPHFTIDTIWQIDNLIEQRKFFPRQKGGFGGTNTPRARITGGGRRGGGGGGAMSGATYMNGEVVGASAPELGADNKGRAMLEKMGWTSGMGIGAVGNKGGLEAIKHVVKTNKAGLG